MCELGLSASKVHFAVPLEGVVAHICFLFTLFLSSQIANDDVQIYQDVQG